MSKFSRTWWGQKFIAAIEALTDAGRLSRGRAYANNGKIIKFSANKGIIKATVRGSVNPYFGVYKEPKYTTEIVIEPIPAKEWSKIIQHLSTNASFVSKLLMNEVPDNIETSFIAVNRHLLPHSRKDFKTECSCPDWSNPCKHIAGLCYRFASELDEDPFLLFELRGLSKEQLRIELAKTPLGQALIAGLGETELAPEPSVTYYTEPKTMPVTATALKEYWLGRKRLPTQVKDSSGATVAGVLVKKQGDFPPFWHQERSFIEVMEEFYKRVRTKNRDIF